MDFDLLPQMTIVLSIAGILFIVGKNFSKVKEASCEQVFSDESAKEKEEKEKFIYLYERAIRRINKENYRKKMAAFWLWLEKFLRKIRLMVMKLDGKMVALVERLRQKNVKTVEEWKKVAETAEKNIQKSQVFFVNKGALRKRRGADKDAREAAEAEAGAVLVAAGEAASCEGQIISRENMRETEAGEDAEGRPEAHDADHANEEDDASGQEPQVKYAENDAARTVAGEEADKRDEAESIGKSEEGSSAEAQDEEAAEDPDKEDASEGSEDDGIRTKKEQECIEMLMKDPADVKAYWKLGIIYSKRRNYEDALACFRQIVKIDPTYTKAKQKVIEVMEKMKKRGK